MGAYEVVPTSSPGATEFALVDLVFGGHRALGGNYDALGGNCDAWEADVLLSERQWWPDRRRDVIGKEM